MAQTGQQQGQPSSRPQEGRMSLCGPYTWMLIDRAAYRRDFQALCKQSLAGTGALVGSAWRGPTRRPSPDKLWIGVYLDSEPAAFHLAEPWADGVYRMRNTVVAPAHRGRGIYRALVELVLEKARLMGYARVESVHRSDNNPILIAKLKAGFVISGMEMDARFGLLVRLVYPFSELERSMRAFRSGSEPWSKQLAARLMGPGAKRGDAGP
jgi:GNAT superfamily N-acetyltransferase